MRFTKRSVKVFNRPECKVINCYISKWFTNDLIVSLFGKLIRYFTKMICTSKCSNWLIWYSWQRIYEVTSFGYSHRICRLGVTALVPTSQIFKNISVQYLNFILYQQHIKWKRNEQNNKSNYETTVETDTGARCNMM